MKRAAALAVTMSIALALTGCGKVGHRAAPAGTNGATTGTLAACTIYAQQHDARITVSPDGQCDALIKSLAAGDTFWSYTPNGTDIGQLAQACDMASGGYEAVVLDDPGGFIGQDVCSSFAAAGWTTSAQPGPLAQQIAGQQAQAQQAQASASAAAATAQQISNLQQSLQSDVAALARDAASLDSDTTLADDIKTMRSDLATEQNDANAVPGANCADGTRSANADQVGADSDQVDSDSDQVDSDISGLQGSGLGDDMRAVRSDVAQLSSLGASPDTDPSAALAAGKKALADTAKGISWAQQKAAAISSQAHQIANAAESLASGC